MRVIHILVCEAAMRTARGRAPEIMCHFSDRGSSFHGGDPARVMWSDAISVCGGRG